MPAGSFSRFSRHAQFSYWPLAPSPRETPNPHHSTPPPPPTPPTPSKETRIPIVDIRTRGGWEILEARATESRTQEGYEPEPRTYVLEWTAVWAAEGAPQWAVCNIRMWGPDAEFIFQDVSLIHFNTMQNLYRSSEGIDPYGPTPEKMVLMCDRYRPHR